MTDVELDDASTRPPGRKAATSSGNRWNRKRRGERLMVDRAEFQSYYGRPILKKPTWSAQDIASYLFLGGLAGASSTLAAAAELTGRPRLAHGAKIGAAAAIGGSMIGLIHDLGRPARFINMLRVFKVTSPMSVGSWLLSAYAPLNGIAAAATMTGRAPRIGRAATVAAGVAGVAVATYTAPLIADTAVPVWHDAHRELPFLFAASAACAASGWGMLTAPTAQAAPARRMALVGAGVDYVTLRRIHKRLGAGGEPLKTGRAGRLMNAAQALTLAGAVIGQVSGIGKVAGRRQQAAAAIGGAALVAGSACTRFGIFFAGVESAQDPRYTVGPQRERLTQRPADDDVADANSAGR
jgi:formate-dependent nitrite reductase membrane component NrfD